MNVMCRPGGLVKSVFVIAALLLASLTGKLSAQSGCAPEPSGLVGWWKGDSNVVDTIGGNNGTLQNGASFAVGEVNQAFAFDGTNQFVEVPDASALDPTNSLTVETWVYVSGAPSTDVATIVTKQSTTISSAIQYQLETYNSPGGLTFRCTVYLPTGYAAVNGTNHVQLNTWYHLAMTYDNASLKLYVNGSLDGSVAATGRIAPTTEPLRIGGAGNGPWFFNGRVDEASLYNRALAPSEILAIYNAGAAGKCATPTAPTIITQPQSQTAHVGDTINFAVIAAGSLPLNYQWQKNGGALSGATTSIMSISGVQVSDAGNYSVIVSNIVGSVISSNAVLTVTGAVACVTPPAGLVSWWKAEGNAQDVAGVNGGTPMGGAGFAAGEVGSGFSFNGAGQFVEVPDSPSLRLTNELTIELWYKDTGSPAGGYYGLIAKRAPYPGGCNFGIDMFLGSPKILQVYIQDPSYSGYLTSSSPLPVPGVFHHIAATFRQAAAEQVELKTYIDGQPVQTGTVSGNLARTLNNAPVTIGADDPNETYFVGVIDEPTIYNRALAPSEILTIYNAGTAGKCAPPTLPTIITQPQSQTARVGDTVSFTVFAAGSSPLSYQWQKNGGALSGATTSALSISDVQLSDAGNYSVIVSNVAGTATSSNAVLTVSGPVACVTPPGGLVSWWKAEGNAQDVAGINGGTLMGGASFAPGEVGSGFSFNGAGQFVQVQDSPSLRLTNEFTVELWYKDTGAVQGHFYGLFAKRAPYPTGCNYGMDMFVTTQSILQVYIQDPHYSGYIASQTPLPVAGAFHHLAATFRQAASEQVELKTYIDGQLAQTSTVSGNLARTVNNAPVTIGADDPNETYFIGIIDEPTIYDRALSAAEISAIYNAGSAGKCNTAFPPTIINQPASQTVQVGSTVNIAAVAGGSAPLSYLWQFNGDPILGETNTSLILSNVSMASAGSYQLVVTNVAGAITSSPAILTVTLPPASIVLGTSTVSAEGTVTTPVNLIANGNENAVSFTLGFDPTLLTNDGVVLGSGASGASLQVNQTQSAAGRVGAAIAMPAGHTFSAGTQQLAVATFSSPVITHGTSTSVSFGNFPVTNLVVDVSGKPLASTFVPGTVLLPASQLEGDVYPRPSGDEALTVSDWVLVGRYVAGLDAPTNALEFQKADCAPRATLGDGKLTVSDWVQAGRYAAGLDPATRVGGPTGGLPAVVSKAGGSSFEPRTQSTLRQVRVSAPVVGAGQTGSVEVLLEAQGNENALGFSLSFDPAQLAFVGAMSGTAANGAVLNINANQAAQGRLGFVLALKANQTFASGSRQMVNVTFRSAASAGGSVAISFGDQPVAREVSDPNASTLATDYINGAVIIAPLPSLSITTSGKSISLSWPAARSGFVLQESSDASLSSSSWTAITVMPTVANGQNVVTVPPANAKKFYRLYRP